MMNYSPDKLQKAAEAREACRKVFTPDELYLLSGAVLCAIAGNNRAAEAACGDLAISALQEANRQLRDLNTKICAMMEPEEKTENDRPDVLVHVYGGMVQAVYSSIPGATCEVYDADTEEYDDGPDAEFNDLRNRPEYKVIW